jgi:hypothetical protein
MTSPAAARPAAPGGGRRDDEPAAPEGGRAERPAATAGGRWAGRPGVIDGVDVDAVAEAARGCPAVDGLCAGSWGGVVSYFAGRQVPGIRVSPDHVLISVRGRWGVPVADLAGQVRAAVAALVAPRRVDIVVADLAEAPAAAGLGGAAGAGRGPGAGGGPGVAAGLGTGASA